MRMSDWSSDVCSSDLPDGDRRDRSAGNRGRRAELSSVGERRVADEGIRPPFVREIAVRAVAGQEDGVAAERPQLPRDRIEQLPVVAARKVRAADRTLEQHVAEARQLRRPVVEDAGARETEGVRGGEGGGRTDKSRGGPR